MKKKVAIVSCRSLNYRGPNDLGMWQDEATYIVSKQALDAVGLKREDLDAVSISTMDAFDGITISNGLLVPAAGAYDKDSVRIENSGLYGIMSGVTSILSGCADLVMVASADTVATDMGLVTNSMQDTIFRGPIGFNAVQSYGLLAMDYMRKNRIGEKEIASVAVKNYEYGAKNPFAPIEHAYSEEEILSSPYICWPLRSLEIGNLSSGAAACILASEEKAKELSGDPIWISGIGLARDKYYGSWDELSGMKALTEAAKKAYRMAGIKDPKEEIDLMEICNPFSVFELIAYETLGLCRSGMAASLLRDGITSVGGDIPVNLSGGTLSVNPPNSGGLFRTVQAVMQLRNEYKEIEIANAHRALVHDSDMMCCAVGGVSHAVMILEKGGK